MISPLTIIYLASILASAIAAFYFRRFLPSRKLAIMAPFLAYVFLQELVLTILNIQRPDLKNAVVYNLYYFVTVLVLASVYAHVPFLASVKKIIIAVAISFCVIEIINFAFIESVLNNSSYIPLIRAFSVTLFALLFLSRYFNLDNLQEERFWRPLLWITIGIVVFYPVISISIAFQKALHASGSVKLYQVIPKVMSIFMYSCFCYAFYLCRKIRST